MNVRSALAVVGAIVIIAGAGILGFAYWPTETRKIAVRPDISDPALIEAGRYVAVTADCVACHSAPGGKPFAGGLRMESPIGVIYSSNITPDKKTGIGLYDLDDFDRLMRHGLLRDGSTVYPAMPYTSYARLNDQDIVALYAYFMKSVKPVEQENQKTEIPFPLSLRWPLAIWRKAFAPTADDVAFDAGRYPDPAVARGAYLVQAAGHCGACHTPRAITLQEEGLDERSPKYLAGGQVIDGWFAGNLRPGADGLSNWSAQDVAATLRTGRNANHAVMGSPMNDVVAHSGQYMTVEDTAAIGAYLKSLAPASAAATSPAYVKSDATAAGLARGEVKGEGAALYVDNCAACHRTSGAGDPNGLPSIAGNSSVLAADPTSLIRIVLEGAKLAATAERPSRLGMPGFDWRLSNDEVADLVTFIRQNFGNSASSVDSAAVGKVRTLLADVREGSPNVSGQQAAEGH